MRVPAWVNAILGREPGTLDLPRDGNTRDDRRQFIAIVVITLLVMVFGLSVVFFEIGFDPDDVEPTPTTPTPAAFDRDEGTFMSSNYGSAPFNSGILFRAGRSSRPGSAA